jgi:hypothetical protein
MMSEAFEQRHYSKAVDSKRDGSTHRRTRQNEAAYRRAAKHDDDHVIQIPIVRAGPARRPHTGRKHAYTIPQALFNEIKELISLESGISESLYPDIRDRPEPLITSTPAKRVARIRFGRTLESMRAKNRQRGVGYVERSGDISLDVQRVNGKQPRLNEAVRTDDKVNPRVDEKYQVDPRVLLEALLPEDMNSQQAAIAAELKRVLAARIGSNDPTPITMEPVDYNLVRPGSAYPYSASHGRIKNRWRYLQKACAAGQLVDSAGVPYPSTVEALKDSAIFRARQPLSRYNDDRVIAGKFLVRISDIVPQSYIDKMFTLGEPLPEVITEEFVFPVGPGMRRVNKWVTQMSEKLFNGLPSAVKVLLPDFNEFFNSWFYAPVDVDASYPTCPFTVNYPGLKPRIIISTSGEIAAQSADGRWMRKFNYDDFSDIDWDNLDRDFVVRLNPSRTWVHFYSEMNPQFVSQLNGTNGEATNSDDVDRIAWCSLTIAGKFKSRVLLSSGMTVLDVIRNSAAHQEPTLKSLAAVCSTPNPPPLIFKVKKETTLDDCGVETHMSAPVHRGLNDRVLHPVDFTPSLYEVHVEIEGVGVGGMKRIKNSDNCSYDSARSAAAPVVPETPYTSVTNYTTAQHKSGIADLCTISSLYRGVCKDIAELDEYYRAISWGKDGSPVTALHSEFLRVLPRPTLSSGSHPEIRSALVADVVDGGAVMTENGGPTCVQDEVFGKHWHSLSRTGGRTLGTKGSPAYISPLTWTSLASMFLAYTYISMQSHNVEVMQNNSASTIDEVFSMPHNHSISVRVNPQVTASLYKSARDSLLPPGYASAFQNRVRTTAKWIVSGFEGSSADEELASSTLAFMASNYYQIGCGGFAPSEFLEGALFSPPFLPGDPSLRNIRVDFEPYTQDIVVPSDFESKDIVRYFLYSVLAEEDIDADAEEFVLNGPGGIYDPATAVDHALYKIEPKMIGGRHKRSKAKLLEKKEEKKIRRKAIRKLVGHGPYAGVYTGFGKYSVGRALKKTVSSGARFIQKHTAEEVKNVKRALVQQGRNALNNMVNGAAASALAGVGPYEISEINGFIPKITGSRDVASNSLFATQGGKDMDLANKSTIRFEPGDPEHGGVVVSKTSFLTEIFGPPTTVFTPQTYTLNPGLWGLFPELASVAANFVEYRFMQLVFCFKSLITAVATSSNGTVPNIVMATNYDVTDATPTSKVEMLGIGGAGECPATSHMLHGVECDGNRSAYRWYFVNSTIVPPAGTTGAQDIKTINYANTILAVVNSPNNFAGFPIGELWCTYKVGLRSLKNNLYRGLNYQFDGWYTNVVTTTVNTVTFINLFGPGGNRYVWRDNRTTLNGLLVPSAAGFTYYFPANFSGWVEIAIVCRTLGATNNNGIYVNPIGFGLTGNIVQVFDIMSYDGTPNYLAYSTPISPGNSGQVLTYGHFYVNSATGGVNNSIYCAGTAQTTNCASSFVVKLYNGVINNSTTFPMCTNTTTGQQLAMGSY